MNKLYLVGSLRNERIPLLAKSLRLQMPGIEVFDDWYAAGPEADDFWKSYEQDRGRSYEDALAGHAAKHVFDFDRHHLDTSSHVLLVLPAGKSGHMELMYAAYGVHANTAILLDEEDVRWDVMYQFVPTILRRENDIVDWIDRTSFTGGSVIKAELIGGQLVPSVSPRRGLTERRVSDGGRTTGLLSKCSCGSRSPLKTGWGQASSGGAAPLGTQQVDRPQEQDYAAPSGQRQAGQSGQSTFHWLGVESPSFVAGRVGG